LTSGAGHHKLSDLRWSCRTIDGAILALELWKQREGDNRNGELQELQN
jgi:hypothetical protein